MADERLRPDIAQAVSKMTTKFGARREIRKLPDYLREGEAVERLSSGMYGGGVGVIVQTSRRLLFIKEGLLKKTTEDFPYSKISSIQWSSGMVMGAITIFVSGNKAVITQVEKGGGKDIVDEVRARIAELTTQHPEPQVPTAPAETPAPPPQPSATTSDSVMEQLRKLAELRDAGVVTPEEFDSKKAEMLRRI